MSAACNEFERTTPRLVEPDTEENLQRQFLENDWTDGLPIVLPTEKRVAEMLAHTSRKPDEVVGRMQPTEFRVAWEYTVEKVAVNAVMAGARPEYFPVILALAASAGVGARLDLELGRRDGRGQRPDPPRDRHELPASARWVPTITPTPPSAAPTACSRRTCRAARCRASDLHGLAGQQLHLQQRHLRRERGAQPLGAAARAEGLQAGRQHGQHLLRLPLDHVLPRPAREILARARARHARRHRRQLDAVPAARSAHRAAVHRPRRLRHQGRS